MTLTNQNCMHESFSDSSHCAVNITTIKQVL